MEQRKKRKAKKELEKKTKVNLPNRIKHCTVKALQRRSQSTSETLPKSSREKQGIEKYLNLFILSKQSVMLNILKYAGESRYHT